MRIIPKKTKVKVEFYRNISLVDILIGVVGIILEILLFFTNFGVATYAMMAIVLGIFICLYIPFDGEKMYLQIFNWIKYLVSKKKFVKNSPDPKSEIKELFPFTGIKDGFIEFDGYYGGVLEIQPKEFRLLSDYKQSELIDRVFASIIRSVSGKTTASLVKIDRPMLLDDYIKQEKVKKAALDKMVENGGMSYEESVNRKNIIDDRAATLETLNKKIVVEKSAYYFVVYDEKQSTVSEILNNAVLKFKEYAMNTKRLNDEEIAVFLKYNYTNKFDEREIGYYEPDE